MDVDDELLAPRGVVQGDDRIAARPRRGDESARHRRDERMPAAVVGVLAEDLEPPRHPERVLGGAGRHALERLEDEVEEDLLAEGLVVAEADGEEAQGQESQGSGVHGVQGTAVQEVQKFRRFRRRTNGSNLLNPLNPELLNLLTLSRTRTVPPNRMLRWPPVVPVIWPNVLPVGGAEAGVRVAPAHRVGHVVRVDAELGVAAAADARSA